jgi:hypothetical protein
MAVALVATYFKAVERVKRVAAIEREHLTDLVAEGRSKYQADRARARAKSAEAPRAATSAPAPRHEKAA